MDNKTEVALGKYEILSSGSVIIPQGETISFSFLGLKFVFEFVEEKDEAGNLTTGHFNMNVINGENGPDHMKISMINQNRSFFSSTSSLIPVATYNNKQIYLKFATLSINQNENTEDKLFFYTWYYKKD